MDFLDVFVSRKIPERVVVVVVVVASSGYYYYY